MKEIAYDYRNQVWVERVDGERWRVLPCGHQKVSAECFACAHHGDVMAGHDEIH